MARYTRALAHFPPGEGVAFLPAPRPNRRLTALARRTADCARPLLSSNPPLFLGIEADLGGELQLLWWGPDLRLVASIAATPHGFCQPNSQEGMLQLAAVEMLAYLAGRWPTIPDRLGVVTDGVGIAFAADHPAPSAPGWLLRHAHGGGSLRAILPLDPLGPCGFLLPGMDGSVH